ncbi:helix-turn-helix domain-containing protein [Gandjariella thermophila]|uniref:helix-turn-helix domain-containing protein n=1 Tax=Gandjariella thermophila TaxID=1931992 RepID=UPI0018646882|nr:helix-turn-helix transcriptional regulator [Gandjariella thermophila]
MDLSTDGDEQLVNSPDPGWLAAKLNALIARRYQHGRRPPGNRQITRDIRAQTNVSISHTYLSMLRNGTKTNPTGEVLEALAHFFRVPVGYFFEPKHASSDAALDAALRSRGALLIAERTIGLSELSLRDILKVVEQCRQRERLDEQAEASE